MISYVSWPQLASQQGSGLESIVEHNPGSTWEVLACIVQEVVVEDSLSSQNLLVVILVLYLSKVLIAA